MTFSAMVLVGDYWQLTDFNIGMIYRLICPCHKLRALRLSTGGRW